MVSDQAKSGFDFLVEQAIKSTMLGEDKSACQIEVLNDTAKAKSRQMVILTVSSYAFRALVFIHFTKDKPTKAHFAQLKGETEIDDAAFLDTVMECGNLACGTINRELGQFFPHLGMSTPSVIDHASMEYVGALGAGHVRHWRVSASSGAVFHLSLAVCEDAPIDFTLDQTETEDSSGELEFF
jgi:hypothetical protein